MMLAPVKKCLRCEAQLAVLEHGRSLAVPRYTPSIIMGAAAALAAVAESGPRHECTSLRGIAALCACARASLAIARVNTARRVTLGLGRDE